MAIITSADYPAIRAALDVDFDPSKLPDDIIALDIYSGNADRQVYERVPNADDIISGGGDDALRLVAAAVYFCAALLCPTVVRITSLAVQTRDASYSKPVFDPSERASELRILAEKEISEVIEPEAVTPGRPTMFDTAQGTRGR